ncbi:hypothetical protein ACTHGU_15825 [Chitinophagaceae bacterium MMS25-I14]
MNIRTTTCSLLTIALAIAFPACKKKDNSPTCRIITITEVSSSGTSVINLTYNNDGKVSTISETGSSTVNKVFTYNSNTIIVNATGSGGTFSERDSISLNSSGQAINFRRFTNSAGTNWDNDAFEYDNSGHVIKDISTGSGSSSTSTTVYTYTNGDLTSAITSGSSTSSAVVEYYADKPAMDGDYFHVTGILNYGFQLIKNVHMTKSITQGTTVVNLSYTYNNSNQVSQLTYTNGSALETVSYQYQCN